MENGARESSPMSDYIDLDTLLEDNPVLQIDNGPPCLNSFIDTGSVESHRYYLSRRTTLEMLRDRGYNVPNSEIGLSLDQFRHRFGQNPSLDQLRISLPLRSDNSKRVLVIFCSTEKLNLKDVKAMFNQIGSSQDLNALILILQSEMTPQAKQELKNCRVKAECFQITDLLCNITDHALMPKHEILSETEKEALLKKFSVTEKQIPRMLETDAVARYYGLQKGQVVKVTIESEITGSHVTYRCVM